MVKVLPAAARGPVILSVSVSPGRGKYSNVQLSDCIFCGITAGTPANSTCQVGLTVNVHTSLQGFSRGAVSCSESVCGNAELHENSSDSESKAARICAPSMV